MRTQWRRKDAVANVRPPTATDDKYSRGVVGMLTGSAQYPGAAVLGVEAAWRTGVGMVRYVGADRAASLILARRPETVTASGRVQAWVIGSGIDPAQRSDEDRGALQRVLAGQEPVIVDAGALDLVAAATAPLIVTPHRSEREKLATLLRLPADAAPERVADKLGAVVVAKGHTTRIVAPDGWSRSVTSPTPWLATAGTGDVLAGIIGALVAAPPEGAQAVPLATRAATGVWIHGRAAQAASEARGGGPITALDVAEAVPQIVGSLLAG